MIQAEGGSEVITLTENEFQLVYLFLHNESAFTRESPLLKELHDNGMVNRQNVFSVTLENTYNGKKYTNRDAVDEKSYAKLSQLIGEGNYQDVLNELNSLKSA